MKVLVTGALGLLLVILAPTLNAGVARLGQDDEASISTAEHGGPISAPSLTTPAGHIIPPAAETTVAEAIPAEDLTLVVRLYCVACHNDVLLTGNLSLQHFDVGSPMEHWETAEKMILKLRAGMMPPPGVPRPGGDTLHALVETLEQTIDASDATSRPGYRSFQRLNQAEYRAAIQDLLGLDVEAGDYLPLDTKSENFDNIAAAQLLSPTLLRGYLRAASEISRISVGYDPRLVTTKSVRYGVTMQASQTERVEGAPMGTRGGMTVMHHFPADGEYTLELFFYKAGENSLFGRGSPFDEQIEVSVDGERVALLDIDRWMEESEPGGVAVRTERISVEAGPKTVSAAFIQQWEGPVNDNFAPLGHSIADKQIGSEHGITNVNHLREMVIHGPENVSGVSEAPTRAHIFTCRPSSSDEERACAGEIVRRLASKAFRRPLTGDDVRHLMEFYREGAEKDGGDFDEGVRMALEAILASPHFVFRLEEAPPGLGPGDTYRVSDVDLATRLSFFLWGSPPDDELRELAAQGRLSNDRVLDQQVQRMLDDPRSNALATRFAAQWLRLADLNTLVPNRVMYPDFDEQLAVAMQRETELLFDYILREGRSVLELLTADYTFVNEHLARHYGIAGVAGTEFRRVSYPDERRRGILGHGSILALTSQASRTSPVDRGKWLLEVFLGTPPPPPPPNVADLDATEGVRDGRMLTVKERMELHRRSPVCASCHNMMDPLGLALENFDVTGAWRIRDSGTLVDPSGTLWDGTPLSGPADLRQALLTYRESLLRSFTKNLMTYALGRSVEYYDMPTVREIVREAAEEDYALSAFVKAVVQSPAFQMQEVPQVATRDEGR